VEERDLVVPLLLGDVLERDLRLRGVVRADDKLYGVSFGSVSCSAYDAEKYGSLSAVILALSADVSAVPQPRNATAPLDCCE
jgi:hypothetical protein